MQEGDQDGPIVCAQENVKKLTTSDDSSDIGMASSLGKVDNQDCSGGQSLELMARRYLVLILPMLGLDGRVTRV